jgi:pyruvate dehydrogenase E2 component (dihydrolipoamide acetyltransferase)
MEFRLPDIGEGVAEAEIIRWLVAEGDSVRENQEIVEVLTDKATVVLPSPATGRVAEIRANAGDTVKVGSVLVVIAGGDGVGAHAGDAALAREEADARLRASDSAAAAHAQTPPEGDARVGESARGAIHAGAPEAGGAGARETVGGAGATTQRADTFDATTARGDAHTAAMSAPPRRVHAMPATRRLAQELGVDIDTVRGTGPGGRVTHDDVRRAAHDREVAPAHAAGATSAAGVRDAESAMHTPAGGTFARATAQAFEATQVSRARDAQPSPARAAGEERVPLRGLRRKIAEAMAYAARTIPHFTFVAEVDMTEVVLLRESLKGDAARAGVKLTFLPFIIRALIPALRAFPLLNASLDDEREEIVLKRRYHVGVATATEGGLIVPVVRDADRRDVMNLAREIERLAAVGRSGRLTREELTGGTFTVTTTGARGGVLATPIIHHPEVAILGVHEIAKRPVWRNDGIQVRDMTNLSLSLDHRVVDGAVGADFMYELKANLEDPRRVPLVETSGARERA